MLFNVYCFLLILYKLNILLDSQLTIIKSVYLNVSFLSHWRVFLSIPWHEGPSPPGSACQQPEHQQGSRLPQRWRPWRSCWSGQTGGDSPPVPPRPPAWLCWPAALQPGSQWGCRQQCSSHLGQQQQLDWVIHWLTLTCPQWWGVLIADCRDWEGASYHGVQLSLLPVSHHLVDQAIRLPIPRPELRASAGSGLEEYFHLLRETTG